MRGGIALLLVSALILGAIVVVAGPVWAADVSFDLYGDGVTGWGFTSGGESIPGPDITVDQGDSVTMHLFSDDALPHQFHIDYDGDGATDAGEPLSEIFTSSTTYTFTASVAGTFTYRCTIHPMTMFGTWVTEEAPATHDVAITFVTTDKTTVNRGETVTISVTVENQGTVSETTTVTAFAGSSSVGGQDVTLGAGASQVVNIPWDTTSFSAGDYLVRGEASAVSGETDTGDNSLTDGTVTVQEPPSTGDLSAELVHRKAWPDRHHYVISPTGSQVFFALVANTGPGQVRAKVVFTVYDANGNVVGSVEASGLFGVGAIGRLEAQWDPAPGKYRVAAQCWFDSNNDGTYESADPGTKDFSFAAVL